MAFPLGYAKRGLGCWAEFILARSKETLGNDSLAYSNEHFKNRKTIL